MKGFHSSIISKVFSQRSSLLSYWKVTLSSRYFLHSELLFPLTHCSDRISDSHTILHDDTSRLYSTIYNQLFSTTSTAISSNDGWPPINFSLINSSAVLLPCWNATAPTNAYTICALTFISPLLSNPTPVL